MVKSPEFATSKFSHLQGEGMKIWRMEIPNRIPKYVLFAMLFWLILTSSCSLLLQHTYGAQEVKLMPSLAAMESPLAQHFWQAVDNEVRVRFQEKGVLTDATIWLLPGEGNSFVVEVRRDGRKEPIARIDIEVKAKRQELQRKTVQAAADLREKILKQLGLTL